MAYHAVCGYAWLGELATCRCPIAVFAMRTAIEKAVEPEARPRGRRAPSAGPMVLIPVPLRAPLAGRHCRIAGRAGLSGLPENPRVLSHLEWTCIPAGRPQPEFPWDVVPAQPPQGVLDRASTVLLLLGRSVHADRVRRALPRLF